MDYAKTHTRKGRDYASTKKGDRPWNGKSSHFFTQISLIDHRCVQIDPGPLPWAKPEVVAEGQLTTQEIDAMKPILRAVVFDFSGVSNLDTTSVQNLVDLRRVLESYADREIEFHFATILSPWIKRFDQLFLSFSLTLY